MPEHRKIPYCRIVCDGKESEFVSQVLESGWLTTAGKTLEFEKRFAAAVDAPFACAVNSCTAALHLSLEALSLAPGDKVFVPTWTFTATAEVVRYLGADPIFLDVEYGSGLLSPAILAQAIEQHPDVRVLMVVHFGGQPAEMENDQGNGLLDLCRKHHIRIVEDAAHAFPTRLHGKMIGNFGDLTCFSFYANKTITTAEGGMVTTSNEALYQRCKVMRLHGIDRDIWNRFTSDRPSWEYDVVAPGFKYNMADVNAAIGLAQLERAEEYHKGRERCARHYFELLSDCPHLDLPALRVPFEDHAWHLFPIILRESCPLSRNQLIDELANRGIGTSVHYKPLHRMRYYAQQYHLKPEDYPKAEQMWRGCVSLPIYPSLDPEETAYVAEVIRELVAGRATTVNVPNGWTFERPPDHSIAKPPVSCSSGNRRANRILLSIPHMGGTEITYVQEAFNTNWLSTVGPNLVALEKEFSEWVGLPSVALGSGTAGLHLAIKLLGIKPGDEVVTPTLTFVASCNPVLYEHGVPVFIDSERRTWNLDPNILADFLKRRAAVNKLPKAVTVVHLFGQSADLESILEVCRPYELPVLEDAAESLGALYRGRHPGTFGAIGVYSFNGNKIITGTTGGMLVSSRKDWVEKARFWSMQAQDHDDDLNNYSHSELGYNYRMSNVIGGIVRGQLEVLEQRVQRRRAVFERYRLAMADIPGIEPQPEAFGEEPGSGDQKSEDGCRVALACKHSTSNVQHLTLNGGQKSEDRGQNNARSSHLPRAPRPLRPTLHTRWLSCFLIDKQRFGASASDLIRFLDAANIEARPVWKPMHLQKLYQSYECIGGAVAEDLNQRGICLPSSSCLSEEDQQFVIDRIHEAHACARARG